MANKNTITVELTVDDKGSVVVKQFGQNADAAMKQAGTATNDLSSKTTNLASSSKSSLETIKGQWLAVTAVAAAAVGVAKQCISAYVEEEAAQMKLAVAMRNQGDFTRESFSALKDYAAQIQKTTVYGDELTIATMANLKTYGMNTEELKRATIATMDLASAKGMDLRSASELVGKAFVGETGTLSRYGIVVDDGLKKTQKFDAVLGQIQHRFGGSAQAEIETYAGQWKQISNWWGDQMETAGLVLLKILEALQFSVGLLGVGFYTTLKAIAGGLRFLVEQGEKLPVIGKYFAGFGDHLRTIEGGFAAAKEGALEFTEKNHKMLTSFQHVEEAAEKMGKGIKAAVTASNKEREKAAKEMEKIAEKAYLKEMELLEARDKEEEEYFKNKKKEEKEAAEAAIALADKQLNAYKDLYDGLEGYSQEYYTAQKNLLVKRAQDLTAVLITEKTSEKDAANIRAAIAAKLTQDLATQNINRLKSSKDFFDGIKAGLEQMARDEKTFGEIGFQVWKEVENGKKNLIEAGVTAFIKGEDAKVAVQKAAGEMIAQIAGKYAQAALNKSIDKIISIIGAYIGQGAAASGAQAASGGVWAAVGEVGLYLGTAVAAMLGGRALASQFNAEGGWIGDNPHGGVIRAGSGVRDDVYLGRTANTRHWGMGGEFVINKEATRQYYDLLQAINSGHKNVVSDTGYKSGGRVGSKGQPLVGDADDLALRMAVGGQLTFAQAFGEAMKSGSDVYGAIISGIVADIAYIATAMGGALSGKLLGNSFKAEGGPIKDMGHWGWIDIILPGASALTGSGFGRSLLDIFAPGVRQIDQLINGKNPTIPIFPGVLSMSTDPKDWDIAAWFDTLWKEFLESQRAGWFNFAETVLTPGDMSFDAWNGLLNELEHFKDHIINSGKALLEPPGTILEPQDWYGGGQIGSPLSARNGLDYVPYDNFPLIAHKGERVQTAAEATEWRGGANSAEIVSQIKALRDDLKAGNFAIAKNTGKIAKILDILEGFDVVGLPAERTA